MDVIGKCAFGIEINCFEGNTDLLRLGNGVFDGFKVKNVMDAFFMNIFLGFSGIENYLDMVPPEMKELWKIFKNVENGRKVPNGDFIDKMAEMKKQVQVKYFLKTHFSLKMSISYLKEFQVNFHSKRDIPDSQWYPLNFSLIIEERELSAHISQTLCKKP